MAVVAEIIKTDELIDSILDPILFHRMPTPLPENPFGITDEDILGNTEDGDEDTLKLPTISKQFAISRLDTQKIPVVVDAIPLTSLGFIPMSELPLEVFVQSEQATMPHRPIGITIVNFRPSDYREEPPCADIEEFEDRISIMHRYQSKIALCIFGIVLVVAAVVGSGTCLMLSGMTLFAVVLSEVLGLWALLAVSMLIALQVG